jgi:protein-tyrosine-phosphatase
MKKVVFICRANMFRSQIATAIYNHHNSDDSIAISCGTAIPEENRNGRKLSSYPELKLELDFMKRKGMDISDKYCTQVTPEALADVSKIILMSEPEYTPEWLKSYKYEFWEVPNPPDLTPETIEDTYRSLEENIAKLINQTPRIHT